MPREVTSDQFSDDDLNAFAGSVGRLIWSTVADVPKAVADQAERFAASNPKPTLKELREHIDHAVAVARGWDDPEDPRVMLHAALKSYYLVAWMEHLLQSQAATGKAASAFAYKVVFTPNFRHPGPDPKK